MVVDLDANELTHLQVTGLTLIVFVMTYLMSDL